MGGADDGAQKTVSENGEVHYWIEKNRDPAARCVVFTHGLTADHTMFERQAGTHFGQ